MQPNLVGRYVKTAKRAVDSVRDGRTGVEIIGKPNGFGGYDKNVELKAGKLGKIDVPTGKVARYGKAFASSAKLVGQAAAAVAAEPFTNKRLNEDLKSPVIKRTRDSSGRYIYSDH